MKNRLDRAEIFTTPTCGGSACGRKWTQWCCGCNGVYCSSHSDKKAHNCKRTDLVRGNTGVALPGKSKSKRKKPSTSSPVPAEDTQLALGETPSGNGETHG